MSTNLAAVTPAPQATHSIAAAQPTDFDQRWAAWQAKGAAHDRAFRRKMSVVAPILLLVAVVVIYALLGR